jgi:hypothetical protein
MANGVVVLTDAEPLICEGASVELRPEADDRSTTVEDFRVAMATMEPGMRCQFRFFVANTTGGSVTVESISLPPFGPSGGSGVRATRLNPAPAVGDGAPDPDKLDAVWRVDQQLEADEQRAFDVWFEFRPGGCSSPGGWIAIDGPEVMVGSWSMSVSARSMAPVGFIGTEHSSCDS